ncbi:MAG TPA: TonB family protein [Verrucomicrobiales bacterium]|nr:TonB family protein [Verrucomicrobiales bacterium]
MGSLAVSLFVHGVAAAVAVCIVVSTVQRTAVPDAGEEGSTGDEGRITVIHRAPRVTPQPKERVPDIVPETSRKLLSSVPSSLVLPAEESRPALPVPTVPVPVPVLAANTAQVSHNSGKSRSHARNGNRGTGQRGKGRLTAGSGVGTAAPSSPRLLTQTAPDYPASARRRGAHGIAWVRVQVTASGSVADASLHRSCGHADLDAAAVRTAKRWRFAPATVAGHAVSAAAVVKVVFVAGKRT